MITESDWQRLCNSEETIRVIMNGLRKDREWYGDCVLEGVSSMKLLEGIRGKVDGRGVEDLEELTEMAETKLNRLENIEERLGEVLEGLEEVSYLIGALKESEDGNE